MAPKQRKPLKSLLDQETLVRLYTTMLRIRQVEETLMRVFTAGEIPGFLHVCIGQEASPAAVCSQLDRGDYVGTTHRGHGHALAKGIDLKLFMAELFGKKNGFCMGRSGSMHVADRSLGLLGANGIVGGGIPIATGAALAAKYKKTGQISACFFGEGSTAQGTFHECLNMASLWKLPIVYVCENNRWAEFTPQSVHMPIEDVAQRAASYRLPSRIVSNDVLEIHDAADEAIRRAREGEGPTLLEVKCHRWHGHFVGDAQKYRAQEDVNEAMADDCLLRFRQELLDRNVLDDAAVGEIEAQIQQEVDEALDFARSSPAPEPSELMDGLYPDSVEAPDQQMPITQSTGSA